MWGEQYFRGEENFEIIIVEPTFPRQRKCSHLLSLSRHYSSRWRGGEVIRKIERSVGVIGDSVVAAVVWGQGLQRDADNGFKVLPSRQRGCISTRRNKAGRGIPVVLSRDNIGHVEACEGGRSVKADQVSRDKLWSAVTSASIFFGQVERTSHCIALFESIYIHTE